MRLLNRNQYCILYSLRCNYECSYCCNRAGRHAARSVLERNTKQLIALFETLEPGLIMVSGGEPLLWRDFPFILEALPQHYWALNTNGSSFPTWLDLPNVKLLIVAFHYEFAQPDAFGERLEAFREKGPRPVVKIIVRPNAEYDHIDLWHKWNDLGVPTHLVPLEYEARFQKRFLDDLLSKYLTSCLYNARFFRNLKGVKQQQACPAGTRRMIQVNREGNIVRCSTVPARKGSIFSPAFDRRGRPCPADNCFCEWHHWAEVAKANDNQVWDEYIRTGVWRRPNRELVLKFIEDMGWKLDARQGR